MGVGAWESARGKGRLDHTRVPSLSSVWDPFDLKHRRLNRPRPFLYDRISLPGGPERNYFPCLILTVFSQHPAVVRFLCLWSNSVLLIPYQFVDSGVVVVPVMVSLSQISVLVEHRGNNPPGTPFLRSYGPFSEG